MTKNRTQGTTHEKLEARLANAEGRAKNLKRQLSAANENVAQLRSENEALHKRLKQADAEIESLRLSIEKLENDSEGVYSLRMTVNQLKRDLDYYQGMAVCERMACLETENRMLRDTFRRIAGISGDLLSAVDETGALMRASMETSATDRKDRV